MEFKTLEYIIAIDKYRNITKAANSLFISQSGLNQMLLKEEATLGCKLFYRSKKNLRPTPEGELYIENARRILELSSITNTQIKELSKTPSGTVSFGLPFEHGVDLFVSISPSLRIHYPNVTVRMREMTVKEMLDNIKSNELDLAFIMTNEKISDDFRAIPIAEERFVLGLPKKHTLSQYASPKGSTLSIMDLSRLRNEKFALMFSSSTQRATIDPLFREVGFKPIVQYESLMNRALRKLVERNMCCTILPQSYAIDTPNTSWFFIDGDPKWTWYIVYSKNHYLRAVDEYLIELSKQYASTMLKHWEKFCIGTPDL